MQVYSKLKFILTAQCPVDTYPKMLTTGENACVPCPANSISTVPNSQSCTCLSGYYRTSEEGPSYACTGKV